jgi:hypothetical protein
MFSGTIFREPDIGSFHLPRKAGVAIMEKRSKCCKAVENPDPQEKPVSGDDITPSQEQPRLPDRLPQSLIEWLARINRRYLALNQEKANDTS